MLEGAVVMVPLCLLFASNDKLKPVVFEVFLEVQFVETFQAKSLGGNRIIMTAIALRKTRTKVVKEKRTFHERNFLKKKRNVF